MEELTWVPFGIKCPAIDVSSCAKCGALKTIKGLNLNVSSKKERTRGHWSLSSKSSGLSLPKDATTISAQSFSCTSGNSAKYRTAHSKVAAVVSVPATKMSNDVTIRFWRPLKGLKVLENSPFWTKEERKKKKIIACLLDCEGKMKEDQLEAWWQRNLWFYTSRRSRNSYEVWTNCLGIEGVIIYMYVSNHPSLVLGPPVFSPPRSD